MIVHGDDDIISKSVECDMQWNSERNIPFSCEFVAVFVHHQNVVRSELIPDERPRIDQICAVWLLLSDVACQMIVVSLTHKSACEQHDHLSWSEVWKQTGRRERDHQSSAGSTSGGSGCR